MVNVVSLPHLPRHGDADASAKKDSFLPLSSRCYRRIGRPLPPDVDLADLCRDLPPDVYKPSWSGALKQLTTTAVFASIAWYLLTLLPWYLLPLGWILAGIAASGLFVIGRDCSYRAWTPSKAVNTLVEIIADVPLLGTVRSNPTLSAALCTCLGALLTYTFGFSEVVKFWILPWAGYMVWRTAMTYVYNSAPDQAVSSSGRILKTVRCYLPSWFETLVNHINVHLPSEIPVPSYNLSAAYNALHKQWSPYMSECRLSARTLFELLVRYPSPAKVEEAISIQVPSFRAYLRRINWLHVLILFGTPALAIYGYSTTPKVPKATIIWAVIYYFFTGCGITAGYHRLWSHKAYNAAPSVEAMLALMASGSVQGSALWWCKNHRNHHRFTDTPADPYNSLGGFWYAHMGWMLVHPKRELLGNADIHDLKKNKILQWQHKYYLLQVIVMAYIVPSVVAGLLWGDYRGGFYFAGAMRLVFVHHSTFCVNSVAHFFGEHTYDDERTPKDHIVTALITLGEGYHNFHHEFPNDYRNGIRWYDYDPTKWLINALAFFGLATELKQFPDNEIKKGHLNMKQKKLDELKRGIKWPTPPENLKAMSTADVKALVEVGKTIVIIDGLVHDVTSFVPHHPGGENFIQAFKGLDASSSFHGGVYKHSKAARNLLSNFRIGVVSKKEEKAE